MPKPRIANPKATNENGGVVDSPVFGIIPTRFDLRPFLTSLSGVRVISPLGTYSGDGTNGSIGVGTIPIGLILAILVIATSLALSIASWI